MNIDRYLPHVQIGLFLSLCVVPWLVRFGGELFTHWLPVLQCVAALVVLYLFLRFLFWAAESGLLLFLFISGVIVVMLARGGPLIGMMP